MIAEDEPDLLELMGQMMMDMGMNVIQARDGDDALVKQEDHEGTIDFLVTDVVMPNLSGVRLAELFSSVRPETKVVFVSGYPASGHMARFKLPEDACLLSKPVQYEKLSGILHLLLDENHKLSGASLKSYADHWHVGSKTTH